MRNEKLETILKQLEEAEKVYQEQLAKIDFDDLLKTIRKGEEAKEE